MSGVSQGRPQGFLYEVTDRAVRTAGSVLTNLAGRGSRKRHEGFPPARLAASIKTII